MGKIKYSKGPKGIKFHGTIYPWKVKKGGISIIEISLLNSNKDLNLTPAVIIEKIEKQGFLSKSFSPLNNEPKWFWITDYASTIFPLLSEMEGTILIPIYINTTTEEGDYKIFIKIQAGEKGLGDYAKMIGKIAASFFIGWRSVKHYFPLKVLKEVQQKASYNEFTSMLYLEFTNFESYVPKYASATIRRDLLLVDKTKPSNVIHIITQKYIEKLADKMTDYYNNKLPKEPKEEFSLTIDGEEFEALKDTYTLDEQDRVRTSGFKYVERINRFVYFNVITDPDEHEKALNVLSSMKFLTT